MKIDEFSKLLSDDIGSVMRQNKQDMEKSEKAKKKILSTFTEMNRSSCEKIDEKDRHISILLNEIWQTAIKLGIAGEDVKPNGPEAVLLLKNIVEQNDDLNEQFNRAKTYTGFEAYACPLCEYKDGKLIKLCSLHTQIANLKEENDELKKNNTHQYCVGLTRNNIELNVKLTTLESDNISLKHSLVEKESLIEKLREKTIKTLDNAYKVAQNADKEIDELKKEIEKKKDLSNKWIDITDLECCLNCKWFDIPCDKSVLWSRKCDKWGKKQ